MAQHVWHPCPRAGDTVSIAKGDAGGIHHNFSPISVAFLAQPSAARYRHTSTGGCVVAGLSLSRAPRGSSRWPQPPRALRHCHPCATTAIGLPGWACCSAAELGRLCPCPEVSLGRHHWHGPRDVSQRPMEAEVAVAG